MNFAFDEEQISLGDTIARVLADHSALIAPELSLPKDNAVWRDLAELGLFAMLVPETFGGASLKPVDLALAVEALGASLAPPSVIATLVATDLLVQHGTIEQQRDLLPRIASGDMRFAIAMTERTQGYDPEAVTTAVRDGMLSGIKLLVADAVAADMFLVLAQSGHGPALYLVPRDAAGITLRAHDDIDPTCGLCEICFDQVELNSDALLGSTSPERAITQLLDVGAAMQAGQLTGLSARMLATSVEYAKTRTQFGQAIGAFQTIKHRCADMAVAVDAAQSAVYYAFWAVSEDAPDRTRATSLAKAYAGEISRSVCNETIQVHGGMGFTWELGLHRFLRRAKVIEHSFGNSAWHHERLLTETLLMLGADGPCSRAAA